MFRSRLTPVLPISAFLIPVVACLCSADPGPKRVFAYYQVPALDSAADVSLEAFRDKVTDVSPTILEITDGAGRVEVTPETGYLDILTGCNVSIAPLVRNLKFDKKIAKWALLSPSAQKRTVAGILDVLQKEPRYSGIVVDIENTSPSDRTYYTEFIARLSDALHSKGYKVYAVVGPKEKDIPKSLWVRAFDYKALGRYSDFVILMTYNQHWRGGPPGPCAALDWFESCVKYAVECIPPEKVIVGIPLYGYDWPEDGPATSLTHKKAAALIDRIKPEFIHWHEDWATPWFTYTEKDVKHEVWFEDVRSVEAKLDVCRKLGVGGVAAWRLGDEDPKFWDAIGRYSRGE